MTNGQEASNWRVTLAYILLGSAGVGIFLCMPVVAPSLIASFDFSAQQVGEFSFIQLAFISLGCLLGVFATRYFNMRVIAMGSIGALLLMDLISPSLDNYLMFLIARGVAGISGGIAMALATGALAQLPGVERNFGMFLFVQIILSMISIWAIPQLVAEFGISGVFYPLVAFEVVVLAICSFLIPMVPFEETKQVRTPNSGVAWICSGISLVAILAFFTAIGAYWTFVGLIGSSAGLSPESVGQGLSLAAIGGLLGSLVPAMLRQRLGGAVPLITAAGVLVCSLYLMTSQVTLTGFSFAAAAFLFEWYLFHPYQLGVLAGVDADGRATMASASLSGLGLGIGPALVSRSVESDLSIVYLVSGVGFILALVLHLGVVALTPKVTASRDSLNADLSSAVVDT